MRYNRFWSALKFKKFKSTSPQQALTHVLQELESIIGADRTSAAPNRTVSVFPLVFGGATGGALVPRDGQVRLSAART